MLNFQYPMFHSLLIFTQLLLNPYVKTVNVNQQRTILDIRYGIFDNGNCFKTSAQLLIFPKIFLKPIQYLWANLRAGAEAEDDQIIVK